VPIDWAHPLWSETARALAGPVAAGISASVSPAGIPASISPAGIPASISIDPELTRTACLRLVSYGGVFWLAVQLGRDRSRARQALVAIAAAGTAYAIYGMIDHFAGWERLLWLDKWAYQGDLTATFVNRNAYGAYAGLGLLCCMGLFLHTLRPSSRTAPPRRAYYDLAETVLVRAMPFLIGAMIIGTALLLSHSRGAFLCTGLGLLVLMAAAVASRLIRPVTALIIGGLMVGIGLGILGLSGEVTVERLASTPTQAADDARNDLYRLTGDAIADAPLTGHGFGAFLPAFRMYRDTSLALPVVWDFAHNVHLEAAMDLGLPAVTLLYLSFAMILIRCLGGLMRRRRDHIYPAVALSAATLIGGHGMVDFSAQMPAVAATLALLLGIGFAQSWRSGDDSRSGLTSDPQPAADGSTGVDPTIPSVVMTIPRRS